MRSYPDPTPEEQAANLREQRRIMKLIEDDMDAAEAAMPAEPPALTPDRIRRNKPVNRDRDRDRRYQRYYGITLADYNAMLEAQGRVCALCHKKPGRKNLSVDHDHVTKRVRGLIHDRCNRALGPFEHDEATIQRVVDYLLEITSDRHAHSAKIVTKISHSRKDTEPNA